MTTEKKIRWTWIEQGKGEPVLIGADFVDALLGTRKSHGSFTVRTPHAPGVMPVDVTYTFESNFMVGETERMLRHVAAQAGRTLSGSTMAAWCDEICYSVRIGENK